MHLHKHKILLILGFRFLYGIRAVTPFAIGASGVAPSLFFPLNAIGAAIWAVAVGILGYFFGKSIELFIEEVKQYEMLAIGLAIAIGILVWWYRRMRKSKKLKAASAPTES
jgi:membrane protein DedA with SNARE-associated domain